jgi:hypothetical protein
MTLLRENLTGNLINAASRRLNVQVGPGLARISSNCAMASLVLHKGRAAASPAQRANRTSAAL